MAPTQVRAQVEGFGAARYAEEIVNAMQASPAGYFTGRNYRHRDVGIYVGMSNHLRNLALEPTGPTWGRAGWERAGDSFGDRVAALMRWSDITGIKAAELPGLVADATAGERMWPGWGLTPERAWETHQAMVAAGTLSSWDDLARGRITSWEEVESCVLAMRIVSNEQVGLFAPRASLESVNQSIQKWEDDGFLERFDDLRPTGLDLFRVTKQAVESGVARGLMSPLEGESRLVVRGNQALHDLAVGDALILAALEIAERQGEVVEVSTETAFSIAGMAGPWPDFQMAYRVGGPEVVVGVEVVGVGANYRGGEKRSAVRQAGFKLFNPGLDGRGARYA